MPSNFTESQRTEVSKVKWFTDRVSFVSSLSDHLSRTRMYETLKRDFEIVAHSDPHKCKDV